MGVCPWILRWNLAIAEKFISKVIELDFRGIFHFYMKFDWCSENYEIETT